MNPLLVEGEKGKTRLIDEYNNRVENELVPADERLIANELIDLVTTAELVRIDPKYTPRITTTDNDYVLQKLGSLRRIDELAHFLPDVSTDLRTPEDQDIFAARLRAESWPNKVHFMTRFVNFCNGLYAIQNQTTPSEIHTGGAAIFALSRRLYRLTAEYHDELDLRSSEYVDEGEVYMENFLRAEGVLALNPRRHVTVVEAARLIQFVKQAFTKTED